MKQRASLLWFLIAWVVLAGCQPADSYRGMVVVDGRHHLESGETLAGSLLVLDGEVTLARDAAIADALYVMGGRISAAGKIGGDVTVIGGTLYLERGAVVGGDLNIGGGTVELAPATTVQGRVNHGSGIEIPVTWQRQPPSVADALLRSVTAGLLLGALAWLGTRFLPRPISCVSQTAVCYPLVSGSLGLLAVVVGLVLLVMMAFTLVLIPVTLLGLVLALLIVAYGWIAYGSALGRWLAQPLPWRLRPPLTAFAGTFLFMLVTGLLGLVPLVGSALSFLMMIVSVGAVLLSRFGTRVFVPAMVSDEPRDFWDQS